MAARRRLDDLADRAARWAEASGPGAGPVEAVTPLTGGTQNVLLRIDRGGRSYVLRGRRGEPAAAARGTVREASVLRALAPTPVPCPAVHAVVHDAEVLGLPFYVADHVDGFNPTTERPDAYTEPAVAHAAGLAVVEAVAALGAVDPVAVGLADLGRPDGFLERQVTRWREQLASYGAVAGYAGATPADLADVTGWLEATVPAGWTAGVMHGDLHLANVLLDRQRPAVAALIDWELATVGDPLVDLGTLLATWPAPDGPPSILPGDLVASGTLPSPAELVAHYGRHSDRDLAAVPWYAVLACFRLGVLLEGSLARAAAGTGSPAVGDALHRSATALFARARHLLPTTPGASP
ncbi:MAG TPA: phosphotransferase family protein [Iamia sp.]|nr:phosphotransferase family protein [Iamia sp.]